MSPIAVDAFDLTGRVALVTGSTRGLGLASATLMAQRHAHVIISSRKQDECERVAAELRDRGLSAEGRACHIGRLSDIEATFEHLAAHHGRLDVLVNNAVLSPWRSIEETEPSLLEKALAVNIGGAWHMSVAAAKLMKRKGRGSIINISSTAARHPTPMLGLYSTFKASLDGMTRSFALELGRHGIRVNTILPGLFDTQLADAFTDEQKRQTCEATPLGRIGDPAELAHAVLFFASDASSYVTGASLVVDGGRTISV